MTHKILVLGPDRKTRGGISSVIKEYEKSSLWHDFNCKWIGTTIDRNNFQKISYLAKGFLIYLFNILRYNLIHIHISWGTTARRKLPFFILAKILNKKVILHLHSASEPVINSTKQFSYKYMFKRADVTIFLADKIKKEILKHYNVKNAVVIYNPCTGSPDREIYGQAQRIKQIVFAGTITAKKGYEDLIKAFALIATEFPDWKLVFAGNGEIEKAENLCKSFNIENQVIFKGWMNQEQLHDLLKETSIFCLPSYTEGFPMVVIEAWSFGASVITTPVGGLPDILVHGENALVFQPGDIQSLSKQLSILISDENLRVKLSENSVNIARELFSIENITDQLHKLYYSALMNK